MIKAFLGALGITPGALLVIGALAAAAGLVALKLYNAGYASADAKWQLAAAQEKERIRQENAAALSDSRRRIAELNALLAKMEEDLRNADEEARLDPNAGRVCLGTGSVRRLNQIQ
jgi:hypothetical protein